MKDILCEQYDDPERLPVEPIQKLLSKTVNLILLYPQHPYYLRNFKFYDLNMDKALASESYNKRARSTKRYKADVAQVVET